MLTMKKVSELGSRTSIAHKNKSKKSIFSFSTYNNSGSCNFFEFSIDELTIQISHYFDLGLILRNFLRNKMLVQQKSNKKSGQSHLF
jgi:hypothetical protein